jgi:Putative prokaryotic signal transducing protein
MRRRGKVIPFPGARRRPEPEAGFAEVCRCANQLEAVVVRSLLESESIQVVLRSRFAQSVHPFSVGAQGEIVILVRPDEAEAARAILSKK